MNYLTRRVTLRDLDVLVDYRLRMFAGLTTVQDPDGFKATDRAALEQGLRHGTIAAWLGCDTARLPVGCACLGFYRLLPKPWNPTGECAYLSSVYVRPEHRRRGLASRLVQSALALAQAANVRVVNLHGSPEGKPIYKAFGFETSNEMRLILDPCTCSMPHNGGPE